MDNSGVSQSATIWLFFDKTILLAHINTWGMSYVHGLGDAQERFAKDWDYKYGWINDLKIICPHCGSEHTEVEGFEQSDSWEFGEEWTIECWCEGCSKEFEYIHEVDYS